MAVLVPDLSSGASQGPSVLVDLPVSTTHRRRDLITENLEVYLPLTGLLLMAFACFLGPLIFPVPGPNAGLLTQSSLPPLSAGHIFGTDQLGNDILSRILYGGRISFEVGFGAQAVGVVLGSALGMVAAFKGGAIEVFIMRIMDMLLAFPGLVIAITIASYLGPSELHVIWAISFFTVPGMSRLARAHTLRLRDQDVVVSSRLCGQKDRWILLRHIAPNVLPNLLTFICLGIGIAIVVEAGLSFLGLGVPPPQPSWGNMIAAGQTNISQSPDLIIIPAAFLFFTVMCLNLLGDAIRSRISSR